MGFCFIIRKKRKKEGKKLKMEKIYEVIQKEVEERVEKEKVHIQEENTKLKQKNQLLQEQLQESKQKITELEKDQKKTVDTNMIYDMLGKGDSEKLSILLQASSLCHSPIRWEGMDVEKIPHWFKLLCEYYEDRETLFQLMDMFEIEYPRWAKVYKMPYDYNEEELALFITHAQLHGLPNGSYFNSNMGFFWRYVKVYEGDSYKLVTKDTDIPWQFVLQNPLFQTELIFNMILDVIEKDKGKAEYFLSLPQYQIMEEKNIARLGEALLKGKMDRSSYGKEFIKQHPFLLKQENFAKKFEEKMDESNYSVYYFAKFPNEMQKTFILELKEESSIEKLKLVKKSTLSQEEKNELATAIINKENL